MVQRVVYENLQLRVVLSLFHPLLPPFLVEISNPSRIV